MEKKKHPHTAGKKKRAAMLSAVALLTAASVTAGSLFATPAALLSDDGGVGSGYSVSVSGDGVDDDDAGVEQDESGETKKRGGVRAALRARVLRLPLAVRLLVVLPLWALGTVLLAAAGAAGTLLSPLLSRIALCALLLALLAGAFVTAAKTVFPDLPLKKVLRRRNLAALLLGASGLTVVDAVLAVLWEDYGQVRGVVLSVGFFAALSCVTLSFALREQRRRLSAPPAPAKQPDSLLFTDGLETYRVRLGERAGSN